jgi:predicted transposase/invertase (TIGR01784 family)
MSKYINPLTDFGFKKLFGEEDSNDILISFLNDLLPTQNKIVKIYFRKVEESDKYEINMKDLYHIHCGDENGNKFIVEMQNINEPLIKDTAIVYSTSSFQKNFENIDLCSEFKAVYYISLLKLNLNKSSDYLHKVMLKDKNNEVFYDKFGCFYIELDKFTKNKSELDTSVDRWIYFFKNLEVLNEVPEIFKDSIFIKAFERCEIANYSEAEKNIYEESLKNYKNNVKY